MSTLQATQPSDLPEVPPELSRLGVQPGLRDYMSDLWRRREFAHEIAAGNLRAQNMDTVLGNVWHLLNPLFLVGVYFLMFGVILDVNRGVENFVAFLAVGVFIYHFTQRAVMAGAKSVVSNEGLVRSIKFPRAVLPVASVLEEALAFLPALGVLLVVALATGEPVRTTWVLLPVIVLLQLLFNLGGGFVVARLTDRFRDVANILPYVFRLFFYLSGALYPVSRFVEDPLQRQLFNLNPMYTFITIARQPVIGLDADPEVWAAAVGWAVVLFVGGLLFFRAGEHRYGRG